MFLSTKILIFDTKMCISKIDVLLVTIVTPKSTVLSTKIFDVLCDLVPFVQFKKREKHRWRTVTFSKVAGLKVTLRHGRFSCF